MSHTPQVGDSKMPAAWERVHAATWVIVGYKPKTRMYQLLEDELNRCMHAITVCG